MFVRPIDETLCQSITVFDKYQWLRIVHAIQAIYRNNHDHLLHRARIDLYGRLPKSRSLISSMAMITVYVPLSDKPHWSHSYLTELLTTFIFLCGCDYIVNVMNQIVIYHIPLSKWGLSCVAIFSIHVFFFRHEGGLIYLQRLPKPASRLGYVYVITFI